NECMKVARAAGARGGTIVHAHGAGVPQGVVFPLNIEPQKDILMIVTRRGQAPAIRRAIYEGMRLERRGAGIIFALPVTCTLGLYEERQQEKAVKP
ncbi:MAG TPA: P-II family nitrogen regulator, partial [Clostridia bacterium]|nr:P-II family nitrogen regulator [Clostridia bacterium]